MIIYGNLGPGCQTLTYRVRAIQPVDMFPLISHVERGALMSWD